MTYGLCLGTQKSCAADAFIKYRTLSDTLYPSRHSLAAITDSAEASRPIEPSATGENCTPYFLSNMTEYIVSGNSGERDAVEHHVSDRDLAAHRFAAAFRLDYL